MMNNETLEKKCQADLLRCFTNIPFLNHSYIPLKQVYSEIGHLLYLPIAKLQQIYKSDIAEMVHLEQYANNWQDEYDPPMTQEYTSADDRYFFTLCRLQIMATLLLYKIQHLSIRKSLIQFHHYIPEENRSQILQTIKSNPKITYLDFVEQTTAQNYLIAEVDQLIEDNVLVRKGNDSNTYWKLDYKVLKEKTRKF